ncbi:hypothetical protein WJ17_29280 [Burkholderia vietnamiensis]|nr:hypothetical protein WJ17_29280 [Burkholderia vietnamiensis]KVS16112.1 hypothetical protein WK32_27780 [Burkholderia vietnamiensis]KVS21173.1 hypothetical protein WK34_22605 [Burkholderia vietnamiensis]
MSLTGDRAAVATGARAVKALGSIFAIAPAGGLLSPPSSADVSARGATASAGLAPCGASAREGGGATVAAGA